MNGVEVGGRRKRAIYQEGREEDAIASIVGRRCRWRTMALMLLEEDVATDVAHLWEELHRGAKTQREREIFALGHVLCRCWSIG